MILCDPQGFQAAQTQIKFISRGGLSFDSSPKLQLCSMVDKHDIRNKVLVCGCFCTRSWTSEWSDLSREEAFPFTGQFLTSSYTCRGCCWTAGLPAQLEITVLLVLTDIQLAQILSFQKLLLLSRPLRNKYDNCLFTPQNPAFSGSLSSLCTTWLLKSDCGKPRLQLAVIYLFIGSKMLLFSQNFYFSWNANQCI